MTKPNDNKPKQFGSPTGDYYPRLESHPAEQGEPEPHPSLAWAPYMKKAKLVAKDAQLSGDVGVIARLLAAEQQCDQLLAALIEIELLLDLGNRDESHIDDALGVAREAIAVERRAE